jgi:hypothetical protein
MIISELIGGLGNQMFQYAAGFSLAARSGQPFRTDSTAFETYAVRSYALPHLCVSAGEATYNDKVLVSSTGVALNEGPIGFDPRFRGVFDAAYLKGYWQSEQYFAPYRDQLISEFKPHQAPSDGDLEIVAEMEECIPIMLHVRRGDYVSNPSAAKFHGLMPIDYYKAGVARVLKTIDKDKRADVACFVFSDDPTWAKRALSFLGRVTVVDHNSGDLGFMDMQLMAKARHHVIANSSFSWWGAWLCEQPGQVVVAPKRWFVDETINTDDLIPSRWIRI